MKSKYLNEIEVAGMVDFLLELTVKPDERILQHVEECYHCKKQILEVWNLIK